MDDMLNKSLQAPDHLSYLSKMFSILKGYDMKPNPNKYAMAILTSYV